MKRMCAYLLLTSMLFLPGCSKKAAPADSAEKARTKIVTAIRVKEPDHNPVLSLTGLAEPRQEALLFFASGGTITDLRVANGSQVSQGQLLAALDTGIGGSGSAAALQLEEAQRELDQKQKDLQRIKTLYEAGAASQAELENAQREVEKAANRVAQCERSLADTRLIAPFSGTVAEVKQQAGQRVSPGAPVIQVVDLSSVKLVLYVPNDLVANFKAGGLADIERDGMALQKGEISFVAPVSDAQTGKYRVEIKVDNSQGGWRGGMVARVCLPRKMTSGIILPLRCVGVDNDQQYVLLIEDGAAKKQSVKAGQIIGDSMEILYGVKANDLIIASGIAFIVEGDKVQVKGE